MSMKRIFGAAAVAASVAIAGVTLDAGLANSAPLRPMPQAPDTPTPATTAPQAPQTTAPQAPKTTAPQAPKTTAPEAPKSTAPATTAPQTTVAPTTTAAPATTTAAPATTTPPASQSTTSAPATTTPVSATTSPSAQTTTPAGQTTSSSVQTTTSAGQTSPTSGQSTTVPAGSSATSSTPRPGVTIVLNPPSIQPPHPPFIPRVELVLPSAQIGGPLNTLAGFNLPGRGAPPPPLQGRYGWNDGVAPGYPPPNWQGPPPVNGWDGAPPPGGWNRPWSYGPPRDLGYGQSYFSPFQYNTFTAVPVFNWQYGGWGYWFFGVWVPLY